MSKAITIRCLLFRLALAVLMTLFLVSISSNVASSFDLKCEFKMDSWRVVRSIKTCYAKGLDIRSPQINIEKVNQKSEPATKIKGFFVKNEVCHYIPKGIAELFPALTAFGIVNSGLKEISKADLENLTELVRFVSKDNEMEYLDDGIFDLNIKLESVTLTGNKIIFIGFSIFKTLPKLTYARMTYICFNVTCSSRYSCEEELNNTQPNVFPFLHRTIRLDHKTCKLVPVENPPQFFFDFELGTVHEVPQPTKNKTEK